jgi:hypothetical protein
MVESKAADPHFCIPNLACDALHSEPPEQGIVWRIFALAREQGKQILAVELRSVSS